MGLNLPAWPPVEISKSASFAMPEEPNKIYVDITRAR